MLLADRSGAASRDDVEAFLRLVDSVAARPAAECVWPDERDEAVRAEALDRLCADLDVQIGITMLKGDSNPIAGTRLRGVAEASGFTLSAAGQFEYMQEDTGAVLYSLQKLGGEPFTVESLRAVSVPGIVLLLDVPRVRRARQGVRSDAAHLPSAWRKRSRPRSSTTTVVRSTTRRSRRSALRCRSPLAGLREAHIEAGGQRALRLFG